MRFCGKTIIENIVFILKALGNMLPFIFERFFGFFYDVPFLSRTSSEKDLLHKKSILCDIFGRCYVTVNAIDFWNKILDQIERMILKINSECQAEII